MSFLPIVCSQGTQNAHQHLVQTTRNTIGITQTSIKQMQETLASLWQLNRHLIQTLSLSASKELKLKRVARIKILEQKSNQEIFFAANKSFDDTLREKIAQIMQEHKPFLAQHQVLLQRTRLPNNLKEYRWLLSNLKICAIAKGTYDQWQQFNQLLQKPASQLQALLQASKMLDPTTPGSYVAKLQIFIDRPEILPLQQLPYEDLSGVPPHSAMLIQCLLLTNNHILDTWINAAKKSQTDLRACLRSVERSQYAYQITLHATIRAFKQVRSMHYAYQQKLKQEYQDSSAAIERYRAQAVQLSTLRDFNNFLKTFARMHELEQQCTIADVQTETAVQTLATIVRQLLQLKKQRDLIGEGF